MQVPSLKLTAQAPENPHVSLQIPSKWWIFHGGLLVLGRVYIYIYYSSQGRKAFQIFQPLICRGKLAVSFREGIKK